MFGHLQLADCGSDMAKGSRALPFQDEGEAFGIDDRIPMNAAVITAHSNVSIRSNLRDTKDCSETLCRLLDSDGFAWDLHNCFYTIFCAFAQARAFMQRLALPTAATDLRTWKNRLLRAGAQDRQEAAPKALGATSPTTPTSSPSHASGIGCRRGRRLILVKDDSALRECCRPTTYGWVGAPVRSFGVTTLCGHHPDRAAL